MKNLFFVFLIIALVIVAPFSYGQGFVNKLKDNAKKEAKKIEKSTGAQPQVTGANRNKLSTNVTRAVAVTLAEGEAFNYSENCIDLGATLSQVSFIVTKQNGNATQCYSYKNGKKIAIACPDGSNPNCQTGLACSYFKLRNIELSSDEIKKYVTNQTQTNKMQAPSVSDEQLKLMAAYMTPAQLEEVKKNLKEAAKQADNQTYSVVIGSTINFNGKTFGPYKQILQFMLTPDNKHFYASISEGEATPKYKLITSASSATLTAPGLLPPMAILASADNSEFAVYATGDGQNYKILSSSGKSYDVPNPGWFHSAWYTATGNHVIAYVRNELYMDGRMIKTFDENSNYEPCNLFIDSDGKNISVVKDNIISFGDGDRYEYPLKISLVNIGGKAYFKWMALENREVVVYQKPL